ncbi:MAG: hypothetical protein AB2L12_11290 [Smithellaceae bacterium]
MTLQPYEQGHLDYYCGIYSIANALKLIDRKMNCEESIKLFIKILCYLEKTGKLGSVAKRGILPGELNLILKQVVSNNYCITVTRPFYRKRKPSIDQLFNQVTEFLEEGSKRALIAAIRSEENGLEHWSVIRWVTKKEIHFFDSDSMKKLQRKKCTTGLPTTGRPYLIKPAEIFFLQKDNTKRKGGRKYVPAGNKR